MCPQTEQNREVPLAPPRGKDVSVVKLALLFYGVLLAVALAWSAWRRDRRRALDLLEERLDGTENVG